MEYEIKREVENIEVKTRAVLRDIAEYEGAVRLMNESS